MDATTSSALSRARTHRTWRERALPPFLIFAGLVCLACGALVRWWPAAWHWGDEGRHYLDMILVVYAVLGVFLLWAAANPREHRSLLLFTAWSSAAHGALMAVQAVQLHRHGHFAGDVLGLLVLAVGLAVMIPEKPHAPTD